MAIKSFNIEEDTYSRFSEYCKENGISMSKQVEFFMKSIIEDEPKVKEEYIEKINRIRKQETIKIGGISEFKKKYNSK